MDISNDALENFPSYRNFELESCLDQFAIEHESIVLNDINSVLTLLPKFFPQSNDRGVIFGFVWFALKLKFQNVKLLENWDIGYNNQQ